MPETRSDVQVVRHLTAEQAARQYVRDNCLLMRGSWIQGYHGWSRYAAHLLQDGLIVQTGEVFTLAGETQQEAPAAPQAVEVEPPMVEVYAHEPVPQIAAQAARMPIPPKSTLRAPATVAPRAARRSTTEQPDAATVPSKADLLARLRPGTRSIVSAALNALRRSGVDTSSIVAQADRVKPGPGPLELVLQKVDGPAAAAARGVFSLLISMGLLHGGEDFEAWLCDAIAERASLIVGAVIGGCSDSLCVRDRPSLVEVLGRDRTHYLEA